MKCIMDVRDVLRCNVLFIGEENLDLKIAILIIKH